MKTQELNISQNMKIVLKEDVALLDDLVVVGYGIQKKESVTGSVAMIDGEELTQAPVATVSETMVGKIPGVITKQPDGRPGANTNLQIRNLGSPLYVIDGVPQGQLQFNNLNPGDIESISVLKDASAAIYGVRETNNVILIITKKERIVEFEISYNGYVDIQKLNKNFIFNEREKIYTYS